MAENMNTKCIIYYELYDLSPKIDKKRREPSARASFLLCCHGSRTVPPEMVTLPFPAEKRV